MDRPTVCLLDYQDIRTVIRTSSARLLTSYFHFLAHAAAIDFDCFLADPQLVANGFTLLTSDHQSQDFFFSSRKLCHFLKDGFTLCSNMTLCPVSVLSRLNGAD
jgi:hypothetical protein